MLVVRRGTEHPHDSSWGKREKGEGTREKQGSVCCLVTKVITLGYSHP